MSTKVIKEGNVTTTIMDLTNGVGGRSAEVIKINLKIKKVSYVKLEKERSFLNVKRNKF